MPTVGLITPSLINGAHDGTLAPGACLAAALDAGADVRARLAAWAAGAADVARRLGLVVR